MAGLQADDAVQARGFGHHHGLAEHRGPGVGRLRNMPQIEQSQRCLPVRVGTFNW
jgi:hypothetical protein